MEESESIHQAPSSGSYIPCTRAMNNISPHHAVKGAGTAGTALKNKLIKTAEKREWIKPVMKWRGLEI